MQNARGSAAVRSESPAVEQQPETPKARKKPRQRRQAVVTLEVADRIKRQKRRKNWRELGEQSDRRWPRAPLSMRRARAAELVLATAAIAPGTPEAFELLGQARDGEGHRLSRPATLKVLRSYMGDALAPVGEGWEAAGAPGPGWLLVPGVLTQRERADALDTCEKTIRNANDDLIASGLLRKGKYVDWGDGMRLVPGREGGDPYLLELRRLEVWLAPAVAEMLGAPKSSKAGNGFPAAFPEGAAGASPNVEGGPFGPPEVDQTLPPSTALYPHDLDGVARLEERARTALRAGNDEPSATVASAWRPPAERSDGSSSPVVSTAPHRPQSGATSMGGRCGPHGSTGGGDLQGRRRPRRRR